MRDVDARRAQGPCRKRSFHYGKLSVPPIIISQKRIEMFSSVQAETKQIVKKRTAFETALVRRVAKKSDFLRYSVYEMELEQLRRKRIERLSAYTS